MNDDVNRLVELDADILKFDVPDDARADADRPAANERRKKIGERDQGRSSGECDRLGRSLQDLVAFLH